MSDTGLSHVIITWACWMTGNVVIPLPVNVSNERLEFLIRDSGAKIVLTSQLQVLIDLVFLFYRQSEVSLFQHVGEMLGEKKPEKNPISTLLIVEMHLKICS